MGFSHRIPAAKRKAKADTNLEKLRGRACVSEIRRVKLVVEGSAVFLQWRALLCLGVMNIASKQ